MTIRSGGRPRDSRRMQQAHPADDGRGDPLDGRFDGLGEDPAPASGPSLTDSRESSPVIDDTHAGQVEIATCPNGASNAFASSVDLPFTRARSAAASRILTLVALTVTGKVTTPPVTTGCP